MLADRAEELCHPTLPPYYLRFQPLHTITDGVKCGHSWGWEEILYQLWSLWVRQVALEELPLSQWPALEMLFHQETFGLSCKSSSALDPHERQENKAATFLGKDWKGKWEELFVLLAVTVNGQLRLPYWGPLLINRKSKERKMELTWQ